MLFDLFGIDRLVRHINRNHGVIMTALENLQREVAETSASNQTLIEALNNLRSDVETVKQQLADAIANSADASTLQGLADQLDAAQTAAREALENNNVPNPTDPVPPPVEEPPPGDGGNTPPDGGGTPTEPVPTDPAQPPVDVVPPGDNGTSTNGENGVSTPPDEPKPLV